jgi:hypothetical protein
MAPLTAGRISETAVRAVAAVALQTPRRLELAVLALGARRCRDHPEDS